MDSCLLPSRGNELLLMPSDAGGLDLPWGFLFDLLSTAHRTPAEAEGQCFRTLVVGASGFLLSVLALCGAACSTSAGHGMPLTWSTERCSPCE